MSNSVQSASSASDLAAEPENEVVSSSNAPALCDVQRGNKSASARPNAPPLGLSPNYLIRARIQDADSVREWFNTELDKLERRKEAGVFTSQQLESEVLQLIRERDLKLSVAPSCTQSFESGGGAFRMSKRKVAPERVSIFPSPQTQTSRSGPGPSPSSSSLSSSSVLTNQRMGPSVVTWWQPALPASSHQAAPPSSQPSPADGHRSPSSAKPPPRRRTADVHLQNPGGGKRGSDKRTPRHLRFKWEVIETYASLKNLKSDGQVQDPCAVTARSFNVNKSQVSSWWRQREEIQAKLSTFLNRSTSAL